MEDRKQTEKTQVFSELAYKDARKYIDSYVKKLREHIDLMSTYSKVIAAQQKAEQRGVLQEDEELEKLRGIFQQMMGNLQNGLIELGKGLETYFLLNDTAILRLLEDCCENLYLFINGDTALSDVIARQFEAIPDALDQSVTIRKRRLTVVAMLYNEGSYVREWVEFHRLVGVDYFYIYDHGSTDNMAELLKPYVDEGIMTVIYYPRQGDALYEAYSEALQKYRTETDYMAFIDGDEFIVPLRGEDISTLVDEILAWRNPEYENYYFEPGGVAVNWRVFGTSGHITKPEGLVMENYLYRAKDYDSINGFVKTICDPRLVHSMRSPHIPAYYERYCNVSERGSRINSALFYDAHYDVLQVNHYMFKSEEEFVARKSRGAATNLVHRQVTVEHDIWMKKWGGAMKRCGEVYDPVMLPYLDRVKANLAKREQQERERQE